MKSPYNGHKSITVVLDYQTGRVAWLDKVRKAETLKSFFKGMIRRKKEALEAIAMDFWDPYIKTVREEAPHEKIVFDLFHVMYSFHRDIDKVGLAYAY